MILSYEEMVASVDKIIHEVCDKEGIEYDHFVNALNDAFDARYEMVEA